MTLVFIVEVRVHGQDQWTAYAVAVTADAARKLLLEAADLPWVDDALVRQIPLYE